MNNIRYELQLNLFRKLYEELPILDLTNILSTGKGVLFGCS